MIVSTELKRQQATGLVSGWFQQQTYKIAKPSSRS